GVLIETWQELLHFRRSKTQRHTGIERISVWQCFDLLRDKLSLYVADGLRIVFLQPWNVGRRSRILCEPAEAEFFEDLLGFIPVFGGKHDLRRQGSCWLPRGRLELLRG